MKTTIARIFAIVALLATAFVAQAREAVEIIDYLDNAVVTGSGKTITADQVKNAIVSAAQSRNWQTTRAPKGDGMQAVLQVRGKHTVVVDITYSAQTYSIKYQSSSNMKYRQLPDTGARVIHPFYNRWVAELREAIRMELNRL